MFANISRTAISGIIMTVVGWATYFGIDFEITTINETLNTLMNAVVALYLLLAGPLKMWWRKITIGPMADGLRGLIFRK